MKKIINKPGDVVKEVLEGYVSAFGKSVRKLDNVNAIIKNNLEEDRVGIVIGGGSGHEPLFLGFVGEGLADGVCCGNVFAAPPPSNILETTKAVNRGKGILYVYGNYAGDNMNFDMAAELAEMEGISTRTVRVWDDAASAPISRMDDRRGIAGDVFVIKIAGAAAQAGLDLEEVYRVTVKARDNTRSMGVAVAPGTIPENGKPTFELGEDEMEIGMGLHGEPGVRRDKMKKADEIVSEMMDLITGDLPFKAGSEVCLLINGLGSTTYMELLITARQAVKILKEKDISIHHTLIGSYCTCQEMAGFSISLLNLDDELKEFYDMPAYSPVFLKR